MRAFRFSRGARLLATGTAIVAASGIGVAMAGPSAMDPPSNAMSHGRGIDEYGMTRAFFNGHTLGFTYTKGYFCDRHVSSAASSRCEVGATFKKAPSKDFDPLFITVPLGFAVPQSHMECPSGLVCVDHPGTVDLTRLEPTLKPLYPSLTNKQLTAALKNYATPGHDHFITTKAGGRAEWWDVKVIGVTSKATYNSLRHHKSYHYIARQIRDGNPHLTKPIPSNIFLFFGVN